MNNALAKRGLNATQNGKISGSSKLKDKLTVAQIMISLFERIENIMERGENASNQDFLHFPQCLLFFPKQVSSFQSHLNNKIFSLFKSIFR